MDATETIETPAVETKPKRAKKKAAKKAKPTDSAGATRVGFSIKRWAKQRGGCALMAVRSAPAEVIDAIRTGYAAERRRAKAKARLERALEATRAAQAEMAEETKALDAYGDACARLAVIEDAIEKASGSDATTTATRDLAP